VGILPTIIINATVMKSLVDIGNDETKENSSRLEDCTWASRNRLVVEVAELEATTFCFHFKTKGNLWWKLQL